MTFRLLFVLIVAITTLFCACKKENTGTFSEVTFSDVIESKIGLDAAPLNISSPNFTLFSPGSGARGYSYSSLIQLNDSVLLVACSKFGTFGDFNESHIVAKRSEDNGKTWSPEFVLQENIGSIQTGGPCLLKISATHVMLFFYAKNGWNDIDIYFKESKDGGKTWGSVKQINQNQGYFILNTDRVLYANNRIILPFAFADDISRQFDQQIVFTYYSDDLGKTWKKSNSLRANFALMEPAICHVNGSELLMAIRTLKGYIFFSRSNDNGATWKNIYKSQIIAPESPQALLRVNKSDTLLLIWNFNSPNGTDNHEDRDPLTIAYSLDRGNTWRKPVNIQSDKQFNYFYPTLYCHNNTLHITYAIRRKRTYEPSVFYNKFELDKLFK